MRAYYLLFCIIFLTLNSCKATYKDSNSITFTEIEIARLDLLNKEKKSLEAGTQTSENLARLTEVNKELQSLRQSVCKSLDQSSICGECSNCDANCNDSEKVNDWINCARKGVLAGGKCSSCGPKSIKNFIMLNPYNFQNNVITKVTFRDASTNQYINTIQLGGNNVKKTNVGDILKNKIKNANLFTNRKYNITVEKQSLNDSIKTSYTIKEYAF